MADDGGFQSRRKLDGSQHDREGAKDRVYGHIGMDRVDHSNGLAVGRRDPSGPSGSWDHASTGGDQYLVVQYNDQYLVAWLKTLVAHDNVVG